jgi:hypothetical protein
MNRQKYLNLLNGIYSSQSRICDELDGLDKELDNPNLLPMQHEQIVIKRNWAIRSFIIHNQQLISLSDEFKSISEEHSKLDEPHKSEPPLKVCEWSVEQGGGAYIAFEESVSIPGLKNSSIRLEFKNDSSIEKVQELAKQLKAAGFVFVVQK